jgi:hypothetical protein
MTNSLITTCAQTLVLLASAAAAASPQEILRNILINRGSPVLTIHQFAAASAMALASFNLVVGSIGINEFVFHSAHFAHHSELIAKTGELAA